MRSDELARYCEAMLYDYETDWSPDGLVEINRKDVLAWKRPGWSVGNSRVAFAKWTELDVDTRIEELHAFFGDTAFNWHVGPSSSPSDLVNRLVSHGLVLVAQPRMMTISLRCRMTGPLTQRCASSRSRTWNWFASVCSWRITARSTSNATWPSG